MLARFPANTPTFCHHGIRSTLHQPFRPPAGQIRLKLSSHIHHPRSLRQMTWLSSTRPPLYDTCFIIPSSYKTVSRLKPRTPFSSGSLKITRFTMPRFEKSRAVYRKYSCVALTSTNLTDSGLDGCASRNSGTKYGAK